MIIDIVTPLLFVISFSCSVLAFWPGVDSPVYCVPIMVLHFLLLYTALVHCVAATMTVFIYHVSYGSLLVRCHRVVNKGCRLSPSAFVAVPEFTHKLHPVFTHKSHAVLAPSSRPVFSIHCPCVCSSISDPSSSKTTYCPPSFPTSRSLFNVVSVSPPHPEGSY